MPAENLGWASPARGAQDGGWGVQDGGWGVPDGGFGAMPPLQEAPHPHPHPHPHPPHPPHPPGGLGNNPGVNPPAQGQKGQKKDGKRRDKSPAPKPLTCKEKRQRSVVALKESFHVIRESVHVLQKGFETLSLGLNRMETVVVEIVENETCCPSEPCLNRCPQQTLLLVHGTCIPNGTLLSREELRGARERNAVERYQHALRNLVNKFWPDETQRPEINGYYLTRAVQVSGFCNRTKTKRYHIQCAFNAGCSNPPNDCYLPPPVANGCCQCPGLSKCTSHPVANACHCPPPNMCYPKRMDQCCPPTSGCYHAHAGCTGPPKCGGKPGADMQANYSYHDFDPKDWDLIIDQAASLYVHFSYE